MNKLYPLLLIVLFAACKSAGKAFNQGDYVEAIERSVRRLQKDPHDGDAKHILQSAYAFAVRQCEERIHNFSNLSTDDRWDRVHSEYVQLQSLYTRIHQSPAAVQAAKPVNYTSYINTSADKAAEVRVQKATALMEDADGDRRSYREAYYQLRTALNFKPADAAILKKLRDAKDGATINVLLMPIDANSGYRWTASYGFRNFELNLLRAVRNGINNNFINIMTSGESIANRTQPDEIGEMRLGTFHLGLPYDETNTRVVQKEVVVKEIVHSKDSVTKEYAKVEARITTTKRLLVSTAELYLDIRDPDRSILFNEMVPAEHRWYTEFATYTGDERALSESDKALLNKKPQTPPRAEAVTEQLLQELTNNTTRQLRNHYSQYN